MIITDEEIWNQVNTIWTENNAKKQDSLEVEKIEPYIMEYCKKFLKDDFESAGAEILKEIFSEMECDEQGAISRQVLFSQLKKTTNPEQYQLEKFYRSLDAETVSGSTNIASVDFEVFEREELEQAIQRQVDEIWRKNSLHNNQGLSYEQALPVLNGFLMATQGLIDFSE